MYISNKLFVEQYGGVLDLRRLQNTVMGCLNFLCLKILTLMSKHHDEEHLSTKQQRLTAKVDDKGRHYCMQEET